MRLLNFREAINHVTQFVLALLQTLPIRIVYE